MKHITPKKVAKDANAIAEQMRKDAAKRAPPALPAPVTTRKELKP